MLIRLFTISILIFACKVCVCQEIDDNKFTNGIPDFGFSIFSREQFADYNDSLKSLFSENILTGILVSTFNENVGNTLINCEINDSIKLIIQTDNSGRFYILSSEKLPARVSLIVRDKNYNNLDTIFSWEESSEPLILKIHPKHKILLRGRIYAGTLPLEGAGVEITHLSDTFVTKTLSCYTDNENYWNCLYLGMFKQPIVFDDPEDTVKIIISKEGFKTANIAFKCNEYSGEIIPVKLRYESYLTKVGKSYLAFKFTPPVFDNWLVSLAYYRAINSKNNKLSLGLEGTMLISSITTQHATFRDLNNSTDSVYQVSSADSSYLSTFLGPSVLYQINSPLQRHFGFYAGVAFPYCFQSKKVAVQPFAGSRFFLDLNKAFIAEIRYVSYNLDVVHYIFNPYGNASRYTKNESFNKFILKFGLQIYF